MDAPGSTQRLQSLRRFRGELRESLLMAWGAIRSHKLRSTLTLLGVMVGVFSIIVVMTIMRAMQSKIENDVGTLGTQNFVVQKWPAVYFGGPEGLEKYWRRKNISLEQGERLISQATLPRSIGLEVTLNLQEMRSKYAKGPPNVSLTGESPGSFAVQNWVPEEGRPLQDADVDSSRDVCVLGNALARTLFPAGSPLGQRVLMDGINYTVVGVLEAKGAMQGGNQDNFAIIPVTTGLNRYGRRWQSLSILVQAPEPALYDETVDQVRGLLRLIRKVQPGAEDDFEINSNDSALEQINTFTFAVRMGVSAVSSIALLAAGVGIMNIMLVSVTERTREIGIRRAVGARKRNIMTQFIMEAVILCEVGGVLGVGLGIGIGDYVAHLMEFAPVIPVDWAVLGLVICSLVGVIFGTYPAYKAANLDPIESLRYE